MSILVICFSAWVVAESTKQDSRPCYDVVHIDRVRGAQYPDVVAHTTTLIGAPRALTPRPSVELIIGYTGVGRPVAELLLAARLGAVAVTLVTNTGGDAVTRGERNELRVPKRELAAVIRVLQQADRLRIAEALPLARTLTEELVNFRVKISLAGHDSYGAGADWRDPWDGPDDSAELRAHAEAIERGRRELATLLGQAWQAEIAEERRPGRKPAIHASGVVS